MILVVGLGNPGSQYEKTRHNTGFMAIDAIQQSQDFPEFKKETKFKAAITKGEWAGEPVILAKPLTFMNLSGEAIQLITHFYKIPPQQTIVIYDDVDLPFKQIRIRAEGGAGTHNGMKSAIKHIGQEFIRVRLGIESRDTHAPQQMELHDFVLNNFSQAETDQLPTVLTKSQKAVETIIKEGSTAAMNQFN